jgi:nucleotide-binding universal stress UspA family protein
MTGRSILVPLDGSAQSEAVLPYAIAVAVATSDRIRLLAVIESEQVNPIRRRLGQDSEVRSRLEGQASSYLTEVASRTGMREIETSTKVAEGTPATEILRESQDEDIAMVAMATHGRGGLQRWALGSVADKVMRMTEVPTLLIHPPEPHANPAPVALNRLLVPLDGSPLAESAIEPAARLANAAGATLIFLRVEPWLSTNSAFASEGVYTPDLSEFESEQQTAAKNYLDSLRDRLPEGVACETVVRRGFPNPVLEDYVAANPVDLVIMSTHGRSGIARAIVGSKADNLVRFGAPTLLIRPREGAHDISPATAAGNAGA